MRILCTICADEVNPSENLHATYCGHLFHHHCLTEWIERSNTCPQCRRIVRHDCMFRLYPTILDETPKEVAILQAKLDEATRALQISNENEELLKVYTLELDNRNNELENLKLRLESEQASLQRCTDLNEELKKNITFLTSENKLADTKNNELTHKLVTQCLEKYRWRDENEILKKNLQILKKTLYKAEFEKSELTKKLYTSDQACIADKMKALSQRLKMGQLSQKNLVWTLARLHAILLASQQTNNNIHKDEIVEKLSKMWAEGIALRHKLSENNNTYDEVAKNSSKIKTNVNSESQLPHNPSSSSSNGLMKEETSTIPNRSVSEKTTEIAINELIKKPTSEILPNGAKTKKSEKLTISSDKPEKPLCESSNKVDRHNEPTKEVSSKISTALAFASTSNQSIIKEQTSKITSNATAFEKSQSEYTNNSPPFEDEGLLLSSLFSKGLIMGPQSLPTEGSSNGHLEPCSIPERLLSEPKSQSKNLRTCDEKSTNVQKDKKFTLGATLFDTSRDQKFTFGVLGESTPQSENTTKIAINELATKPTSDIEPNDAKPNTTEKLDITRDKPLFELSNIPTKQPTKEISTEISPAFIFASTSKESPAFTLDLKEDHVKQRISIPLEGSSRNVIASTSCDILNGSREFISRGNPLRSESLSRKPSNVTRDNPRKKLIPVKSKGYHFEVKPQQTKFSFGSKPQQSYNPSDNFVNNHSELTGVLAESATESPKEFKHVLNAVACPRANGQAERFNQTIFNSLSTQNAFCHEREWDKCLGKVQYGINNTTNATTRKTATEALFGFNLREDLQNKLEISNEETANLQDIRDEISENIDNDQSKQKERYDAKRIPAATYQIGDLVKIKRNNFDNNKQSTKLLSKFVGPYKITEVLGNDRYKISDIPGFKKKGKPYSTVIAADRMRPWIHIKSLEVHNSDKSSSSGNSSESEN